MIERSYPNPGLTSAFAKAILLRGARFQQLRTSSAFRSRVLQGCAGKVFAEAGDTEIGLVAQEVEQAGERCEISRTAQTSAMS